MEIPEFEIKFHFGAKTLPKKDLYIAALFLNLAVNLLSRFTKLSPIQLWALIDEIGRKFQVRVINEIILNAPELLEDRIRRDVDSAIMEYNGEVPDVEIPEPTQIDIKEGETPLGGTLGFTYDFMEKDNDQQN